MSNFRYSPLDLAKNTIRLLLIHKGNWKDDIFCTLIEALSDADEGIPYKALSYTWGGDKHRPGGPENLPNVWVDNQQFDKSPLTDNLFGALRQIREIDRDVVLWTDAICIDQSNDTEKGHQVNQMGAIYSAAEEVLVWLGPGNEYTEALMKTINWINQRAEGFLRDQETKSYQQWFNTCRFFALEHLKYIESPSGSSYRRVLEELLSRKWFKRVWVLQEIALAKTAIILCGSSSCTARTFGVMPALLGIEVDDSTQARLDVMPRIRKRTWWSSQRRLHHLIGKFGASEATIARDRIYALLHMSEDARGLECLRPCYKKSDSEVFRDTASFIMFGEVLSHEHALPEFTIAELGLPILQLVEKAFSWALREGGRNNEAAQKTVNTIIEYLSQGRLECDELLKSLSKKHSLLPEVSLLLSHGKAFLTSSFGEKGCMLKITSAGRMTQTVQLSFPKDNPAIPLLVAQEDDMSGIPPMERFLSERPNLPDVWAGQGVR
ncbi:het-domain-containing protein [Fusarium napiforme]|uniref:Het-domain-containing protein n=1 Tax=Fusarium napiforme TaxID=42672 RepID=A0A8H5I9K0_9HYPO|nr:het-domain-containing protein [Fusarium napiforme]